MNATTKYICKSYETFKCTKKLFSIMFKIVFRNSYMLVESNLIGFLA